MSVTYVLMPVMFATTLCVLVFISLPSLLKKKTLNQQGTGSNNVANVRSAKRSYQTKKMK